MKFGLSDIDLKKIQQVFSSFPEIEQVIIYGSRAKGNYKPASDIDITLVGTGLNLTIQQKMEQVLDDLLLPYKFDVSIYNQISNPDLLDHIKRIGLLFYKKQY